MCDQILILIIIILKPYKIFRENYESILRAMKKPNGHLNLLDLDIQNYDGQDYCGEHYRLKKILTDYKDNISALDLLFSEDLGSEMVSFLKHEDMRFPLLEKLSIEKDKSSVDNLLKKHAEQLTYLELKPNEPNFPHNYSHFPKFHKLETLIVEKICPDNLVSLLSLCSESLSTLSIIEGYYEEEEPNYSKLLEQLPELPKLQTLELYSFSLGKTVKTLISKCRQTLTGIVFDGNFDFEMEDNCFPKLKYLKFQNVDNVDVMLNIISANACQLETLILRSGYYLILSNKLSNIKNLCIYTLYNCSNMANILKCDSSLQCLVIFQPPVFEDFKFIFMDIKKMPNLTDFYLLDIDTSNWFMDENIKDFLVKNADSLEFLVLHFNYSYNTEFETMESTPPVVELKKVHTLIILQGNPLLDSERQFFKALCPNAQIMKKNGRGGEYIREAVKSRLKYSKADDLFCQEINDIIFWKLKY